MGALEILALALTHPNEFRILLQFWNYHESKRDITKKEEHPTSGWDRPTMRRCWELLDHSSRSFSGVIKQLDGDLARIVSLHSCPSPPTPLLTLEIRYAYSTSSSAALIPSKMTCPSLTISNNPSSAPSMKRRSPPVGTSMEVALMKRIALFSLTTTSSLKNFSALSPCMPSLYIHSVPFP
jgi:hypothetical protein